MSTDYYLACKKCKKAYHVAQDGLSGFTFYSGEAGCMAGMNDFLGTHTICDGDVKLISEHMVDAEDYDEVRWPYRFTSAKPTAD